MIVRFGAIIAVLTYVYFSEIAFSFLSPFPPSASLAHAILSWLSGHGLGGLHGSTNWVAIDDRDLVSEDGGEALRGRFVQTAFASGLTRELADRAITMLLHGPQPCPEEERPPNVRTLQDLLAEAGVDAARRIEQADDSRRRAREQRDGVDAARPLTHLECRSTAADDIIGEQASSQAAAEQQTQ